MSLTKTYTLAGTLAVLALASVSTGCATKKYVRNEMDPVRAHLENVDKQSSQNTKQIAEVDERLSKQVDSANERAMAADNKAQDAGQRADKAMEKANSAGDQAASAKQYAEQGFQKVDTQFQAVGKYSTESTETILFNLNKFELTADAKATLDATVEKLGALGNYQIEVEGFTDATGSGAYNDTLSRKRADAVVRYLTVEHQIPLYRVHVIGLGEAKPVADNKTRDGRKENRRVEVRVLKPELGASSTTMASTTGSN